MAGKRKISKDKGVNECVNLLYSGITYGEIVRTLTETYGLSNSAVEKWIKAARPIVEERIREDSVAKREIDAAAIQQAADELNISRKRVLEEYMKIAFFDVRKVFSVDGGVLPLRDMDDDTAGAIAGLENYDDRVRETGEIIGTTKKIKIADKRAALDSICRMMGYNAPDKAEITGKDGSPLMRDLSNKSVDELNGMLSKMLENIQD